MVSKFDSEIKNVAYIDETTTEGQLEDVMLNVGFLWKCRVSINLLYDDIKNDLNISGQWYVGITSVKESYPKPS